MGIFGSLYHFQTTLGETKIKIIEKESSKLNELQKENAELKLKINKISSLTPAAASVPSSPPPPPPPPPAPMAQSIGLSTLSFFKPIMGQKDKTHSAALNLKDIKIVPLKDSMNLQFNIVNQLDKEVKLAGHIIVLLKNEQGIQFYPNAMFTSTRDYQMSYTLGESFATQRFRPVDAPFIKPKKLGPQSFTIFIFAKNGDLLHFQTVNLPARL